MTTTTTTTKLTYGQLYEKYSLLYIRYDACVETRANGQKKIKGIDMPAYSKIRTQKQYKKDDGKYYSLLMGVEYQTGKWLMLLDLDNKTDEASKNGKELIDLLNLDDCDAPKQFTPSGGVHYLFYVDAKQKDHIGAKTGLIYNGIKYNADVKFRNGLCNCQPTKIPDYGKYEWEDYRKLKKIPKLPDRIFDIIKNDNKHEQKPAQTAKSPTTSTIADYAPAPSHRASAEELQVIEKLCSCLTVKQLDDYDTWIKLGRILKKLGAPLALWDTLSKKSSKYQYRKCAEKWQGLNSTYFTIRSLHVQAKNGDLDLYNRLFPPIDPFIDDDQDFKPIEIDTPYLVAKDANADMNEAQKAFQDATDDFMRSGKTLVVRSRYGSGKTTFLQKLIKENNMERVLFITYRQTLARDIMRNFKQLGFKNYLNAHEDPDIWNAKKLIVQLDSLMNVLLKSNAVANEERFDLQYDLIVLDESESLLAHFDEGTMEHKEINIFDFFDKLLEHCKKVAMLDGDVSKRTLEFAKHYGSITYIKNKNKGKPKTFNLIVDEKDWYRQLESDLEQFYNEDKGFKVCIASQSSSRAVALEKELKDKIPFLAVKSLVGTDSGETKRAFMEDVNEALKDINVFIYSPVIESGVDITIKVKKVYGILCSRSNCPRAYCQMLARCRDVEVDRIDVLNDPTLKINDNHNFWTSKEVLELNKAAVDNTPLAFMVKEGYLEIDKERHSRRKTVSIYNTTEKLNKHTSLFINYLKGMCISKGMDFQITQRPADSPKAKKTNTKNYKVEAILAAKDLTNDEYDELAKLKKTGNTTTEQNCQVDKHYWKRYLATKELDEQVLKAFVFSKKLLTNFLTLIDEKNHEVEDNLRSSKLLEQVRVVRDLLDGLGFASVLDDKTVDRESFMTNFHCNICDDAILKNKKRINELFELSKGCGISTAMNSKQILNWSNAILKPFSLKLVAEDRAGYRIEVQHDMLDIINRRFKKGHKVKDQANLLQLQEEDPFMDDEERSPVGVVSVAQVHAENEARPRNGTARQCRKTRKTPDTALLDVGVCDSD